MKINYKLINNKIQREYDALLETSYEDLCELCNKKYGKVNHSYGKSDTYARANGLFIHHKGEDIEPGLSEASARKTFPELQKADQLVYCNYIEHLLLHVKIIEKLTSQPTFDSSIKTTQSGGVGKIRGLIGKFYETGIGSTNISKTYYDVIDTEDYRLFFMKINELYNGVFGANQMLYQEMVNKLNETNKCLVILGCGGGKTTTALGYIKEIYDGTKKALVVCPKTSIKDSWLNRIAKDKNGNTILDADGNPVKVNEKYVETITYSKLARSYKCMNFDKYSCVVCDEFHHANSAIKSWGKPIAYILDNTNLKLIGLTAEKFRSTGEAVAEAIFGDSVVEGKSMAEQIASNEVWPFSFVSAIYDMPETVEEYLESELGYSKADIEKIKTAVETKELYGKLRIELSKLASLDTILKTNMPNRPIKGLIFSPSIEEIPATINLIKNTYPDETYLELHYDMTKEEKEKVIDTFENMEHGFLVSVDMVGEGMHFKGINTLICLRKTRSPLVLNQQLGRLTALKSNVELDPMGIVFDLVNNKDSVTYRAKRSNKDSEGKAATEKVSALKTAIKKAYEAGYSTQKIIKDYAESASSVILEIEEKLRIKSLNLNTKVEQITNGTIEAILNKLTDEQQESFNKVIATMSKKIRGYFDSKARTRNTVTQHVEDYMKTLRKQEYTTSRSQQKDIAKKSSQKPNSGRPVEKVLSVFVNLLGLFTILELSKNSKLSLNKLMDNLRNETSFRAEYFYVESESSLSTLKANFDKNKQIFIDLWKQFIDLGRDAFMPLVEDIVKKVNQAGIHKIWLTLNSLFTDDIVANNTLCEKMFDQFGNSKYTYGDNLLNPCCGRGTFLKYANEKLGYPKDHLAGFDIDENYVTILNNLGYTKVICANIFDNNLEERLENL